MNFHKVKSNLTIRWPLSSCHKI